jgi:hypothetical protein
VRDVLGSAIVPVVQVLARLNGGQTAVDKVEAQETLKKEQIRRQQEQVGDK